MQVEKKKQRFLTDAGDTTQIIKKAALQIFDSLVKNFISFICLKEIKSQSKKKL